MKKRILAASCLLFSSAISGLYAYETEWEDPAYTDKTKTEESTGSTTVPEKKNSSFKVYGMIWTSYEFLDRSVNGTPDQPGEDKAGFKVGRARLRFQGKVNEGFAKGYNYLITLDTARAAHEGDGCASSTGCQEYNDYLIYLKDAYLDIPVPISFGKNSVRIGQQHTPTVENQSGYHQIKTWDHRYLDTAGKGPWDETKLSNSRDVGISLIHKNTYYGFQFLLANGEGYHHGNAEGLDISASSVNLEDIATGKSGASYGYDLYSMLSFTPTGKSKDLVVHIGFPFRFHNIIGSDQSEYRRTSADYTDLNAPKYSYYRGDKRAIQDITYGAEAAVEVHKNTFDVTVSAGTAVKLDRAGSAFKFDETVWFGVNPGDYQAISDHYALEEDRYGFMNFGYIHAKYKKFGAFARIIDGSTGSKLSSSIQSRQTNKSWVSKLINTDIKDGEVGNLTLQELGSLNNVNAMFRSTTYGVEYIANERFRIALGTKTLEGTDPYGKDFRQNDMEKIESQNPSYKNVSQQLTDMSIAQNQQNWAALGYGANDQPDMNDWIGKKRIDREVFIRAEYAF